MKKLSFVLACAFVAILFIGCNSVIVVKHDELNTVVKKRTGNVIIRTFDDKRIDKEKGALGVKRNGFGMPMYSVKIDNSQILDSVVTKGFADALSKAGYNAIIEDPQKPSNIKANAIVYGDIMRFWTDCYMAVWTDVQVHIKVQKPQSNEIVWENNINSGQTNMLLWGSTDEFDKVIRQGFTNTLNKATTIFASDDFYNKAIK